MTDLLTTTDMLDKLDDFTPGLLRMRDQIDAMLLTIKTFKHTNAVGSTHSKVNVIFQAVISYYGVSRDKLKGRSRIGEIVVARQFFCALCRDLTELSHQAIGDYVNRDHATVIHSKRVIQNAEDSGDTLFDHYEVVKKNVLDALDSI